MSSQGPKRAITDAVACTVRIQPGTHRLQIHPPNRSSCKCDVAIKAMPSIQRYGHVPAVGRRQCRGSGVDGEGLMEAAQEASLFSPRDHWPLHHINSWSTPWWSLCTQESSVLCIRGYVCRSPTVWQCDKGNPPSTWWRAEERRDCPRRLPGRVWPIDFEKNSCFLPG